MIQHSKEGKTVCLTDCVSISRVTLGHVNVEVKHIKAREYLVVWFRLVNELKSQTCLCVNSVAALVTFVALSSKMLVTLLLQRIASCLLPFCSCQKLELIIEFLTPAHSMFNDLVHDALSELGKGLLVRCFCHHIRQHLVAGTILK